MTNSPVKVGGYYDVPARSAVADVSARTTRDGYAITATFIRLDVAEEADERTWTVRSTYPAKDLARDGWAVGPAALARGPIHLQPNMGTDLSVDELLARSASKARSCASDEDRQAREEIMALREEVAGFRYSHPSVVSIEQLALTLVREGHRAHSEQEYLEEQAGSDVPSSTASSEYARGLGDAFVNAAKNIQRHLLSVETTGEPADPRYESALDPDRQMDHEQLWQDRERRRKFGVFNGPTSDFPDPVAAGLVVRYTTNAPNQTRRQPDDATPTVER